MDVPYGIRNPPVSARDLGFGIRRAINMKRGGRVPSAVPQSSTLPAAPDQTPSGTDTVPAMLSPGEFVMPADTVRAVGMDNLDALRAATHAPTGQPVLGIHRKNGNRGDEPKFGVGGVRMADGGSTSGAPALPQKDPNSLALVGNQPAPSPFWIREAIQQIDNSPAPADPRADMTHGAPAIPTRAVSAPAARSTPAPVASTPDTVDGGEMEGRQIDKSGKLYGGVQFPATSAPMEYRGGITGTGNVAPVGKPYAPGELSDAMFKAQNGQADTRSFNAGEMDAVNSGIRARGGVNSFSNVDSAPEPGFGIRIPAVDPNAPPQDELVANKIAAMNQTAGLQRQVNNLNAGVDANGPTGPQVSTLGGVPTLEDDMRARTAAAGGGRWVTGATAARMTALDQLKQGAQLAQMGINKDYGIAGMTQAGANARNAATIEGQYGVHRGNNEAAIQAAKITASGHVEAAGINADQFKKQVYVAKGAEEPQYNDQGMHIGTKRSADRVYGRDASGNVVDMTPQSKTPVMPTSPSVPPGHIAALKAGKVSAEDYDEKYGQGAAKSILGK